LRGSSLPLSLRAYRLACVAATPLAPRLLAFRRERGKENGARLSERCGKTSLPRPAGALVWVHTASVGEMFAALALIERLRAKGFAVLVTSGTVTSAALAEARLPVGAVHQFVPLDAPRFVARFLDHWRPDLALFVESDLWPNLILDCAERRIPLVMVNGRISERSFRRWRRLPEAIAALLQRFDLCLTQSSADAERYAGLGAPRVSISGNLKLDAPAPPVDATTLSTLKSIVGTRPVIAAASTHPGEEEGVVAAHRRLRAAHSTLLTVIAPRHPQRGADVAEIARTAGLAVALRSRDEEPTADVDVYVADTVGELGLIYRIAPIVFMGGSLVGHGGQNPVEAVKLGAAILHGPNVWNFAEIYAALDAAGGAECVADADELATRIGTLLTEPAARAAVAMAAAATVGELGGALEHTLAALEPYLLQLRRERR